MCILSICNFSLQLHICLFVCTIRTHKPLDRFFLNFIGELGRTPGMYFYMEKYQKSVFTTNHIFLCDVCNACDINIPDMLIN